MQATLVLKLWEDSLVKLYGTEVGGKLANQQVEVGMTAAHMASVFGEAPAGQIQTKPDGETVCVLYGSPESGNYFELHDNVITKAILGRPAAYPDFVYDWPGIPL